MTGTSEVEARPTFPQSPNYATESPGEAAQQQQSTSPRGAGDRPAGDDQGQVWSVAEKARAAFDENLEPAKRTAKEIAEEQKSAGARKIGDVAHVVHDAASQLQPELPWVAKSIHDAAGALEQAAARLRQRSVDDLIGSCTSFARSQPIAFFGAAALAGFVAARFLKSSADPTHPDAKT